MLLRVTPSVLPLLSRTPDVDEAPLISLVGDSALSSSGSYDSNGGQDGGITGASTGAVNGASVTFVGGGMTGGWTGEETGASVSGPAMGQNSSAGLPKSVCSTASNHQNAIMK